MTKNRYLDYGAQVNFRAPPSELNDLRKRVDAYSITREGRPDKKIPMSWVLSAVVALLADGTIPLATLVTALDRMFIGRGETLIGPE